MAGQPPKKGSWGDWAIIEPKPNQRRITCSFCAFYQDDGSCSIHPIVISEVGYSYWRQCSFFLLDDEHDTHDFRDLVNRVKRYDSPYQPYNEKLYNSLCKKRDGESYHKKDLRNITINIQAKNTQAIDCYYVRKETCSGDFICNNHSSLLFQQICRHCPQYIREVFMVKGKKMSRCEFEALSEKDTSSHVCKKEMATHTRAKKKTQKTPKGKAGNQKKSNPTGEKQKLVAKPNVDCKYCISTKCIILQNTCTRGGVGCLFFKPK